MSNGFYALGQRAMPRPINLTPEQEKLKEKTIANTKKKKEEEGTLAKDLEMKARNERFKRTRERKHGITATSVENPKRRREGAELADWGGADQEEDSGSEDEDWGGADQEEDSGSEDEDPPEKQERRRRLHGSAHRA